MHTYHLQIWTKTLGIIVFGAFIGIWLGHQDRHYQPGPDNAMTSIALQQSHDLSARASYTALSSDQSPQT
ncbi:hypothetical protein HHS34_009060 [Acidithiobacillus montserratensis]|uniref:Uncharacterized protein n=1 Tax=Acidithiobacillus montserratensis TaxID=2729135 RepID=A0ACD5HCL9_9PROT|nr:hypothetical protein [Acidithiobacillus montserratensis]MBN2679748.1 hypothetical protein [Acidithiobacillaceae bacterium]MBU2748771.1 hypothetical protein [Acidithiobacillus montserratensis]